MAEERAAWHEQFDRHRKVLEVAGEVLRGNVIDFANLLRNAGYKIVPLDDE